jgi:hypothetical protein
MYDSTIRPVITLYQPWASWIMRGWKIIETRTHDRFKSLAGKRILIHAGKKTDETAVNNPYLSKEQILYKPDEIINGAILGECLVQHFQKLDASHSKHSLIDCGSVERWGLFLNEIMMLEKPIEVAGEMGIWYFDLETKQKVKKKSYQAATLFGL